MEYCIKFNKRPGRLFNFWTFRGMLIREAHLLNFEQRHSKFIGILISLHKKVQHDTTVQ